MKNFLVASAVIVFIFGAALFGIITDDGGGRTDNPLGSGTSPHDIVYKISTDREAGKYSCPDYDVTYEMPSGTAQKSVAVCHKNRIGIVDRRAGWRGDFVYLSVQGDKYFSKISCQIYIDGRLVHQTYSEGQYVIASCSGSIP